MDEEYVPPSTKDIADWSKSCIGILELTETMGKTIDDTLNTMKSDRDRVRRRRDFILNKYQDTEVTLDKTLAALPTDLTEYKKLLTKKDSMKAAEEQQRKLLGLTRDADDDTLVEESTRRLRAYLSGETDEAPKSQLLELNMEDIDKVTNNNNNNNENNVGNNNNSGEEGEQAEKKKTRKKPSGPKLYLKEQVRSIKFNNNEINTWVGFDEALKNAIDSETVKSTDLQFLDCSFNMLQTIGSCLEKYDKIRVLYLHGNKIGNLQDIKRLKNLKEIQKLTLHGNPIEEKKNYRKYVTCMLPTLKQLDFTPITLQDRNQAKVWMERRLRNKQRKEEGGY